MVNQWFYPVEETDDSSVTAYIFDSHRPYQHTNVNEETKRINCVDDGCKSFMECPTAQDMSELAALMEN